MKFDQVYLVSLPYQHGQLLRAMSQFNQVGIEPIVFNASDGYAPPLYDSYVGYSEKELGDLEYFKKFKNLEKGRKKKFIESAGAYGYINTYIRILKDAKEKGFESILIFEDDVILADDFMDRFDSFYSKLPSNWKFITLGASQYNWDSVDIGLAILKGFYTPKQLDTCGSFAIGIDSSIYNELIELQSYFEAPFDHLPLGEIYNRYPSKCFVAYPNIVMADVSSSNIRGSRNQLQHAKKMKWDLNLFSYPPKLLRINLIVHSIP